MIVMLKGDVERVREDMIVMLKGDVERVREDMIVMLKGDVERVKIRYDSDVERRRGESKRVGKERERGMAWRGMPRCRGEGPKIASTEHSVAWRLRAVWK
jgi:hypothetical protein